jgi:phosphatidylglycerol:prolipoprotein diacylglycerol transferase
LVVKRSAYTLALMAGVMVSSQLLLVVGQNVGISLWAGIGALALLLGSAMTGARLLFVATHWDRFSGERRRVWRYGDPGAASFGGIGGALLACPPLALALGVHVGTVLDLLVIAGLPGLAVGRVGCWLNGCCPGRNSTVSLQVLQIAGALLAWMLALVCGAAFGGPGTAFFVGTTVYSLQRFFTEFLRELPRGRHGLAVSQLVALALTLLGAVGLVLSRTQGVSS